MTPLPRVQSVVQSAAAVLNVLMGILVNQMYLEHSKDIVVRLVIYVLTRLSFILKKTPKCHAHAPLVPLSLVPMDTHVKVLKLSLQPVFAARAMLFRFLVINLENCKMFEIKF